ncbi:hypothetical protein ES705_14452 [subsurface metagenome]
MVLKDVIRNVREKADAAHSAFHAGHHDKAKQYLAGIRAEIVQFEAENPSPAGDVTESATTETPKMFSRDIRDPEDVTETATSEKLAETQTEKPAEVPGAQEWPGAVHSEHAVPPVEKLPEFEKSTQ